MTLHYTTFSKPLNTVNAIKRFLKLAIKVSLQPMIVIQSIDRNQKGSKYS